MPTEAQHVGESEHLAATIDGHTMKIRYWSAVVLIGFGAASATHCNIARALTYEETACVARMYQEDKDPAGCFNTGGDGGSAGSGGSGSDGGKVTFGGPISGVRAPSSCSAPSFFPMGPPNPAQLVVAQSNAGGTKIWFLGSKDGLGFLYTRASQDVFDASGHSVGTIYTWSAVRVDAAGHVIDTAPQTENCWE